MTGRLDAQFVVPRNKVQRAEHAFAVCAHEARRAGVEISQRHQRPRDRAAFSLHRPFAHGAIDGGGLERRLPRNSLRGTLLGAARARPSECNRGQSNGETRDTQKSQ